MFAPHTLYSIRIPQGDPNFGNYMCAPHFIGLFVTFLSLTLFTHFLADVRECRSVPLRMPFLAILGEGQTYCSTCLGHPLMLIYQGIISVSGGEEFC